MMKKALFSIPICLMLLNNSFCQYSHSCCDENQLVYWVNQNNVKSITVVYDPDTSNNIETVVIESLLFSENGVLIERREFLEYLDLAFKETMDTIGYATMNELVAKDNNGVEYSFKKNSKGQEIERQVYKDSYGTIVYDLRQVKSSKPFYYRSLNQITRYDEESRLVEKIEFAINGIDEWTSLYDTSKYLKLKYSDKNTVDVVSWKRKYLPTQNGGYIRGRTEIREKSTRTHDTISVDDFFNNIDNEYFNDLILKLYRPNSFSDLFSKVVIHSEPTQSKSELTSKIRDIDIDYSDYSTISYEFLFKNEAHKSLYYDKSQAFKSPFNEHAFLGIRELVKTKKGGIVKNFYFTDSCRINEPELVEWIEFDNNNRITRRYGRKSTARVDTNDKYCLVFNWDDQWVKEDYTYKNELLSEKKHHIERGNSNLKISPDQKKYRLICTCDYTSKKWLEFSNNEQSKVILRGMKNGPFRNIENRILSVEYWN